MPLGDDTIGPDFSRGGGPFLGQVGQQAASQTPGLLQMAQSAMDGSGQNNWAPQWVTDMWNSTPADSTRPSDRSGEAQGITQGRLAAWYNPANWGPPPPLDEGQDTWFPSVFSNRGPGSNDKFWTMKDYDRQRQAKYGGQLPEVGDERPNTFNSRFLANSTGVSEPGSFMYLGHQISPGKLIYDLNVGKNPPAGGEGGGNQSPIRRIQGLGPENPASFIHGSAFVTGLPGQLENWAGGSPYWT